MKNFKLINTLAGWSVFFLSLIVYTLTLEPTASFWDSGEFIAASYKLQVPHPPGPPLFLLVGRMFSLLALNNPEMIAYWVNMVSAVSSASAVMFLYWSIVLIGKKIIASGEAGPSQKDALVLIGAGITGSLAFAFSDSFWFSAVEAEVYAMSMLFTAVAFWAILRWDAIGTESLSNRWLLFIAYIMGLSIGVHPMNLLTIPSLALIYYFKHYQFTWSGLTITLVSSLAGILMVMFGFRVGVVSLLSAFEIFFVNKLGLGFGVGAFIALLLIVVALASLVLFSQKKNLAGLNTLSLCLSFLIIGYSSFGILTIRSSKNPLIDMWNPENLPNFVSYLDMKQYGTRPLLFGNYYDARLVDQQKGAPVYQKRDNSYVVEDYDYKLVYEASRTTLLPRIYSQRDGHPEEYRRALGLKEGQKPDFADNIRFLLTHQLGHMYVRYFMWNFSGRESDLQDANYVALASSVPPSMEGNHARNNFLMLPLVLGLVGLFFSYRKHIQSFSVVGMLFLITGVGLVLYLNAPPAEPRERDYIYVASFFAFCIWIGLGALAFLRQSQQFFEDRKPALLMAWFATLMVPGIMIMQGWDDHNRSGRYYSTDMAKNHLVGCAENGILFTGGDNDTYPLWYAQDVEGVRTDMRVIVGSLFGSEWNIDMMKRKAYESAALPFSIEKDIYKQGGLIDYVPVVENANLKGTAVSLPRYLDLLRKQHPAILVKTGAGATLASLPSRVLRLPVNKSEVIRRHLVPDTMKQFIPDYLSFEIKGNGLQKSEIMLLDLIVSNNWDRPIYFTYTALHMLPFDLTRHVVQEGMTYRLLPVENPYSERDLVNTEVMFANMVKNYSWRNLDNPDVNYSSYYTSQLVNPRMGFNSLAEALMLEGKNEQALEALHKSLTVIPDDSIPFDISAVETAGLLMALDDSDTALSISKKLLVRADADLQYYQTTSLGDAFEVRKNLFVVNRLEKILRAYGFGKEAREAERIFRRHYSHFEG